MRVLRSKFDQNQRFSDCAVSKVDPVRRIGTKISTGTHFQERSKVTVRKMDPVRLMVTNYVFVFGTGKLHGLVAHHRAACISEPYSLFVHVRQGWLFICVSCVCMCLFVYCMSKLDGLPSTGPHEESIHSACLYAYVGQGCWIQIFRP